LICACSLFVLVNLHCQKWRKIMTADPELTFYHSPLTRSSAVLMLLEELGAPYELHVLNFKTGEQREPAYLAVNPLGKVPAIVHGDSLVTEIGAIFAYLPDAFPSAGLAPPIGDPLRGPYLRWLVFYGSAFEPAIIDRHMMREPPPHSKSAYGTYDEVMGVISAQLNKGPYLLGEPFTAADVLWGAALDWTTKFGLVPATPEIAAYVERVTARPSFAKVNASDAQLFAQHEAAAAARG
jgi:glutathione S-transferase